MQTTLAADSDSSLPIFEENQTNHCDLRQRSGFRPIQLKTPCEVLSLGLDFIDNRLRKEPEKLEHLEANPHYSNPPYSYPEGIQSAVDVPNVTEDLLERGYTEPQIKAILGGNLLRVYETVWTS